jgi:hypothetical protein
MEIYEHLTSMDICWNNMELYVCLTIIVCIYKQSFGMATNQPVSWDGIPSMVKPPIGHPGAEGSIGFARDIIMGYAVVGLFTEFTGDVLGYHCVCNQP